MGPSEKASFMNSRLCGSSSTASSLVFFVSEMGTGTLAELIEVDITSMDDRVPVQGRANCVKYGAQSQRPEVARDSFECHQPVHRGHEHIDNDQVRPMP